MKKMLTGILSLFILMAIAKVLVAQPSMEEAATENAIMDEDNGMMDEGSAMMDEGSAMMEEGNMMMGNMVK